MKILALLLLLTLTQSASADGLSDYVLLRAKNHARTPASFSELNAARDGATFELAGRVTGTASGQAGSMFMMTCPQFAVNVLAEPVPDWFATGEVAARVLVRVEYASHVGSPTLRLITAISEQEIARYEGEQRRIAEQKRAAAAKIASRKAGRQADAPDPIEQMVPYKQAFPQYKRYIQTVNPRLTDSDASNITKNLLVFSWKQGVDPRLVVALMLVESRFNPTATSYKGAQGLGQLMPRTAGGMGVTDAYDPKQNIEATVRLVRGHLLKYKDPSKNYVDMQALATAMAAYNAGSGAVRKYGGIPPYKQTQNHVRKVISVYRRLCGQPG